MTYMSVVYGFLFAAGYILALVAFWTAVRLIDDYKEKHRKPLRPIYMTLEQASGCYDISRGVK